MLEIMRNFAVSLPGSEGNLYLYHIGFSSTMGVLLIAYGSQALMTTALCAHERGVARRVYALHAAVSGLAAVLSLKFFFLVPVVFMSVASIAFCIGFYLKRPALSS